MEINSNCLDRLVDNESQLDELCSDDPWLHLVLTSIPGRHCWLTVNELSPAISIAPV